MGKLIVLEGTDGSGKATQTNLLYHRLKLEYPDRNVYTFDFPDYESNSSALVKMYLNGDFGKDPSSVNPYAASLFYTVDRYASFKMKWEDKYNDPKSIIVLDRYTTANIIHQGSKLSKRKQSAFNAWICSLEYRLVGLPEPDVVYLLHMPTSELVHQRSNSSGSKEDIHEAFDDFQVKSREAGLLAANELRWKVIHCIHEGVIRTKEDIHEEIYNDIKMWIGDI